MADRSMGHEGTPQRLTVSFAAWLDSSGATEKEFFENGLIVLDANVLLALYEIGADARREMLAALVSVTDRLWVPHQAALEFSRNRKRVVIKRTSYFSDVRRSLRAAVREATDLLEATVKQVGDLRARNRTSRPWSLAEAKLNRSSLEARLAGAMDSALTELDVLEAEHDLHPGDMQQADSLFVEIDQLLTGRIGSAPSRQRLRELVDEAISFRFPNRIPPGYADANKDTPLIAAGDYLLWREVLDRAGELQATAAGVLLVTSETKPDWWLHDANKKPLRARPELVQEMREETGVGLLLVSLADFLTGVRHHFPVHVSDETVEQVREAEIGSEGAYGDWRRDSARPLDLLTLPPVHFEYLIRDLLLGMGYTAVISKPGDNDGFDLRVLDSSGLVPSVLLVEAKRYRRPVGVETGREIFGVMIHLNASGAIIVTTSTFTPSTINFVKGKPIRLIDGAELVHLLAEHLNIKAVIDFGPDLDDHD
jgi:restriction endonuclease Mrr